MKWSSIHYKTSVCMCCLLVWIYTNTCGRKVLLNQTVNKIDMAFQINRFVAGFKLIFNSIEDIERYNTIGFNCSEIFVTRKYRFSIVFDFVCDTRLDHRGVVSKLNIENTSACFAFKVLYLLHEIRV